MAATKKEWQEQKRAQNERYRSGKAKQGLKLVSIWVPADAAEKIKDMKKVGIVVCKNDIAPFIVEYSEREISPGKIRKNYSHINGK